MQQGDTVQVMYQECHTLFSHVVKMPYPLVPTEKLSNMIRKKRLTKNTNPIPNHEDTTNNWKERGQKEEREGKGWREGRLGGGRDR